MRGVLIVNDSGHCEEGFARELLVWLSELGWEDIGSANKGARKKKMLFWVPGVNRAVRGWHCYDSRCNNADGDQLAEFVVSLYRIGECRKQNLRREC